MEPVKYQLSKREFITVTELRFYGQKRISFYQLILMVLIILSYSMEGPTFLNVACFAIIFFCFPILTVYYSNKIVKDNPELFVSETTLSADNDGIKVISSFKSSELNWPLFKKWTENRKYIFLYLGHLQALTVPKRAFTNEQLMEFKTLLSEKIWPFPGETRTTNERYARRALILAVTSFILSNSPLILPFIGIFFEVVIKSEFPRYIFVPLVLLGLLSSLPIAIVAYRMGKRMKASFTMINLTRILSLLAILAYIFWVIGIMLATFLPPRGF